MVDFMLDFLITVGMLCEILVVAVFSGARLFCVSSWRL